MDAQFTAREIIFGLFGGSGIIALLVWVGNFLVSRYDIFQKSRKEKLLAEVSETADLKKAELQIKDSAAKDLVANLWLLIENERKENEALRTENKELEAAEVLSRPTIVRFNRVIRSMRKEMDKISVIMMDVEKTRQFADRWDAIKDCADQLEAIVSGDTPEPTQP